MIRRNHVIDDATLGNLLAAELTLGTEIVAVVIAKVIIARNRERFNASIDEELGQNTLELCLSRLQVVTANERLVLLRELNDTRNESVLGSAVYERSAFEDRSNSEDGARRDFVM